MCQLYKEAHKGHQAGLEFFKTTNQSKLELVENLQVMLENKQIIIPNNAELIKELSVYERTLTADGHQRFNAPTGLHDDRVMSLMFAAWAYKNRNKKGTSVNTTGVVVRPWDRKRYI